MYAHGMTVREIQGHLLELYGLEVSPDPHFDGDRRGSGDGGRMAGTGLWNRWYPLVFFDALRGQNPRRGARSQTEPSMSRLASRPEGTKDILGLWIETSEGAKFWLRVMTELKNRGVEDILIAVVDGLKGFPGSYRRRVPADDRADLRIVHLIRQFHGFRLMERPQADRR